MRRTAAPREYSDYVRCSVCYTMLRSLLLSLTGPDFLVEHHDLLQSLRAHGFL